MWIYAKECQVIKKMLLVALGFGMITVGIAGITTSLVDQKNQASLRELEKIQDEARTAAAEEQKKLEEKQQEIDRLALKLEAERLHLREERLRAEEQLRSKMADSQKQKKAATNSKKAARKDNVTEKAPRVAVHEEDVRTISQKVGMEAARAFVKVKYYNRNTRELVLAEPLNSTPGSVLVRVRVWRSDRLAQDTLINFSKTSLGDPRRRQPYL
jgi:hypothetical protein